MPRDYMGDYKQLGTFLLEENLIRPDQLDQALRRQQESGEQLGDILVDMWLITEEDKLRFLGKQMGIPYITPKDMIRIDSEVVRLIPEKVARQYYAIPFAKEDDVLTIVMADPFDVITRDNLGKIIGHKIKTVIGSKKSIEEQIDIIYKREGAIGMLGEVLGDLSDIQIELKKDEVEEAAVDVAQLREQAKETPLIRLVNYIIANGVSRRASDIHIEPSENKVEVRYRIDGMLYSILTPPKYLHMAIVSRIKVLAEMDLAERRLPQDGHFTIRLDQREMDIRVSTLPTSFGEKVVLRILDKGSFLLGLEQLGLEEEGLRVFKKNIYRPHGLILITGPTGSGKSTTLYSALNEIKSPEKNIVTIEDPVECQIQGIHQVQANPKIDFNFFTGFRAILRQDPDIIMVGEIRDTETAEIAIRSALTGHLVLSTLHTNDAVGTIIRLVNMGIEPFLVASSLALSVAQRLVRRICSYCKESYIPSLEILETLKIVDRLSGTSSFYQGKGCARCNYTGYYGRIALFEMLEMKQVLKNLVLANAPPPMIKNKSIETGMINLYSDGLEKVFKGYTTIEEVVRVCFEED